jgi:hypothetical protein
MIRVLNHPKILKVRIITYKNYAWEVARYILIEKIQNIKFFIIKREEIMKRM